MGRSPPPDPSPPARKRGRPRAFDVDTALRKATTTFLRHGYSGASVDDLTTAMGLSKPSLYAAFGDKRNLFLRALEDHAAEVGARYREAFLRGGSLEESLREMFEDAVGLYTSKGMPGCPYTSAATTEAVVDPGIAEVTREFFALCDRVVASWVRRKLPDGASVDPEAIARLANGTLHDIAVRARVGEPKAKLLAMARDAAKVLGGLAR